MGESDGVLQLRLEAVRWHILRFDSLRSVLWARATAILSADTLIGAGAAIFLTRGGATPDIALLGAAFSLIALLISVYKILEFARSAPIWTSELQEGTVMTILSRGRHLELNQLKSPPPLIYSATETILKLGTYERFERALLSQSIVDELGHAMSELWRLQILHHRRTQQTLTAVRWLFLGVATLMLSAVTIVVSSWRH